LQHQLKYKAGICKHSKQARLKQHRLLLRTISRNRRVPLSTIVSLLDSITNLPRLVHRLATSQISRTQHNPSSRTQHNPSSRTHPTLYNIQRHKVNQLSNTSIRDRLSRIHSLSKCIRPVSRLGTAQHLLTSRTLSKHNAKHSIRTHSNNTTNSNRLVSQAKAHLPLIRRRSLTLSVPNKMWMTRIIR
jgi:hypothetical protein